MVICANEKDVTEVLPNLWLGNYKVAMNRKFIDKFNIKYIINITTDSPNMFSHVQYLHVPIKDKHTCGKNMNKFYDDTTNYILQGLKQGCGVLVHCKRGHHRSASVVAAFLMRFLNIEYLAAVTYINKLRRCALLRKSCLVSALFNYYLHITKIKEDNKSECNCLSCGNNNVKVMKI